jgi:hypothetical protein
MDTAAIIDALEAERDRLDSAIEYSAPERLNSISCAWLSCVLSQSLLFVLGHE